MNVADISDKERAARRGILIRVFNMLNAMGPDVTLSRQDLFGTLTSAQKKWSYAVLNVLRAHGFVDRVGTGVFVEYSLRRPIPTDERVFALCMTPYATLAAMTEVGGAGGVGAADEPEAEPEADFVDDLTGDQSADVTSAAVLEVVVSEAASMTPPPAGSVEGASDALVDAPVDAPVDTPVDASTDDADAQRELALPSVPPGFDPLCAIYDISRAVQRIQSRMALIEHRLMATQTQIDDLLQEWTGGRKR